MIAVVRRGINTYRAGPRQVAVLEELARHKAGRSSGQIGAAIGVAATVVIQSLRGPTSESGRGLYGAGLVTYTQRGRTRFWRLADHVNRGTAPRSKQ